MEEDFWNHLEELRKRLILSICFFLFSSVFFYPFSGKFIKLFTDLVGKTYFFAPQEALFIRIKFSFMAGFVIALPLILHQLYLFVVPALTKEERRFAGPLLFFLIVFFYGGLFLGYFIFLPYILKILLSFQTDFMVPLISITKLFSFVFWVLAGFGISFEMPVFFFVLSKLGVITPLMLFHNWRFGILFILVFAAIITPTVDVVTMVFVAFPLFFLYFISIIFSFLGSRSKNK
ncbi:MAG: twin-arginine translocase subunit TatC [candidate division WOR-3 bacterium]